MVAALVVGCLLGPAAAASPQIQFREDTEAGLEFVHFAGRSAAKYVPEVMGSGVAWMDFDVDGWWDVYLVDSGALPGVEPLSPPPARAGLNRLFRGREPGRFRIVPDSGLEDPGYGMGVAAADYDNDGWVDVYVTNFQEDALFRNNGDGTFANTSSLLPADGGWSASAAWGDLDGDGWLDLYVTNYLDYPLDAVPLCSNPALGVRQYCPPQRLAGKPDQLYRGLGGTDFRDITAEAGMIDPQAGKGLGVMILDLTDDGLPDVYVANDTTSNFFYVNRGDLSFEETALFAGVGLSDFGRPESGMGVAVGELDGADGYEIAVTNFMLEPVSLYSPAGNMYAESSFLWGVGESTLDTVGFGIVFIDAEGDGDLDIVVVNGHVFDEHGSFAQPNQVFRNERSEALQGGEQAPVGPLFTEISGSASADLVRAEVSRGLAVADYDLDGRPDLALTNSDGPARLFRNVSGGDAGRLAVRLRGRTSNRDAVGATVQLRATAADRPDVERRATVLSGASYLSRHAGDLYFGLADVDSVDLQITWPDGSHEEVAGVTPGQLVVVQQGRGVQARRALETHERS